MKRLRMAFATTAVLALVGFAGAQHRPPAAPAPAWNARGAATYLDGRMNWWLGWRTSARDHGTSCVSCHTAVPFALARPGLRATLADRDTSDADRRMMEYITKRVRLWKDVEPFYPDQTNGLPKSSESRGTEAVLNALILSQRDASAGTLSDDTRQALDNLWPLQFRTGQFKGAWAWLNFGLDPWEGTASAYYGASLAAIAVGGAPGGYAARTEVAERVVALRDYLRRGADTVSTFNRAMALWASSYVPDLLEERQRQGIIDALVAKQRPDGGWSVSTLGPWVRRDNSMADTSSDGYATGLVVLALQRAGRSRSDTQVSAGIDWLVKHQDPATGMWTTSSVNKQRDPATDIGKFMSDAATAYATMALLYKEK